MTQNHHCDDVWALNAEVDVGKPGLSKAVAESLPVSALAKEQLERPHVPLQGGGRRPQRLAGGHSSHIQPHYYLLVPSVVNESLLAPSDSAVLHKEMTPAPLLTPHRWCEAY